jgi:1-deoxy-D-xylulose-5-phosphate reductoisomerase
LSALPEVDAVMAAIVGAAGLEPTLAAARAGKRVMLANKEVLVMAGELFMHAVREHGATLLPVDSEHNAIFQSLPADFSRVCRLRRAENSADRFGWSVPYRGAGRVEHVTPDQACAHPNWVMGRKISVDSATMMNKGLRSSRRAGCSMRRRK